MEIQTGNIFVRPNGPMDLGSVIPGHKHNFDHVTICFYGAFRVVKNYPDGTRREVTIEAPRPGYEGPSHVLITAGIGHEIIALTPGSIFWCVYSHRNPQGEVVQKYEGFDAAYGICS